MLWIAFFYVSAEVLQVLLPFCHLLSTNPIVSKRFEKGPWLISSTNDNLGFQMQNMKRKVSISFLSLNFTAQCTLHNHLIESHIKIDFWKVTIEITSNILFKKVLQLTKVLFVTSFHYLQSSLQFQTIIWKHGHSEKNSHLFRQTLIIDTTFANFRQKLFTVGDTYVILRQNNFFVLQISKKIACLWQVFLALYTISFSTKV